jgi:hypothetical protein
VEQGTKDEGRHVMGKPHVEMVSGSVIILLVEGLMESGVIRKGIPRSQVYEALEKASTLAIGDVFMPKGRYLDWHEE